LIALSYQTNKQIKRMTTLLSAHSSRPLSSTTSPSNSDSQISAILSNLQHLLLPNNKPNVNTFPDHHDPSTGSNPTSCQSTPAPAPPPPLPPATISFGIPLTTTSKISDVQYTDAALYNPTKYGEYYNNLNTHPSATHGQHQTGLGGGWGKRSKSGGTDIGDGYAMVYEYFEREAGWIAKLVNDY
jgi:hypothetical protein